MMVILMEEIRTLKAMPFVAANYDEYPHFT